MNVDAPNRVTEFKGGLDFLAGPPDQEKLSKTRFVIIRHALTEFNLIFAAHLKKFTELSEETKPLRADLKSIDMGLRPEGIIQCEKSSVHSDKVNFKYVFVSQMVRTIETAVHLFKSHPNRKEIKFIVLPLLKEGFNCAYDLCLTNEALRKKVDPLISQHELDFDFNLLNAYGVSDLVQADVNADFNQVQKMY